MDQHDAQKCKKITSYQPYSSKSQKTYVCFLFHGFLQGFCLKEICEKPGESNKETKTKKQSMNPNHQDLLLRYDLLFFFIVCDVVISRVVSHQQEIVEKPPENQKWKTLNPTRNVLHEFHIYCVYCFMFSIIFNRYLCNICSWWKYIVLPFR